MEADDSNRYGVISDAGDPNGFRMVRMVKPYCGPYCSIVTLTSKDGDFRLNAIESMIMSLNNSCNLQMILVIRIVLIQMILRRSSD